MCHSVKKLPFSCEEIEKFRITEAKKHSKSVYDCFKNMDVQKYLDVENEGETIEDNSSEEFVMVDGIYSVDDKIQDDLDLIAFVEGNPRLYAKGKVGYKNIQEKDMAWISIGKALKHPINGSEAKHRWDTLRNLYGRSRREILTLMEQQGRSGSGTENISYENLFSPQSMAIHRFMGHQYVPRRTVSNYNMKNSTPFIMYPSSFSASSSAFKCSLPSRPYSKSLTKSRLGLSNSKRTTTLRLNDSPVNASIRNQNFAGNISANNETTDTQTSLGSLKIPVSHINKGKKTDLEIESTFEEYPNDEESTDSQASSFKVPISDMKKRKNTDFEIESMFEELDYESTDNQTSRSSFKVPMSDIKKRKKTDLEAESMIQESSHAIVAACSALPALLNSTKQDSNSKIDSEEDKGIMTLLLHALKRVPEQHRTKCFSKILEVVGSFQQD